MQETNVGHNKEPSRDELMAHLERYQSHPIESCFAAGLRCCYWACLPWRSWEAHIFVLVTVPRTLTASRL